MTQHTDMVLETDLLLGKLMEILESRGLSDNTLVCITSDNGGIPVERSYGHDAVGGLRGKKSYIFEGGTRVPFVVRWPKHIPAGNVRNQVVGTHDIVATALDLAGVSVPQNQCLDSVSLKPVLLGTRDDRDPVRKSLLTQSAPGNDFDHDGGFATAAVVLDTSGAKAAKEEESSLGSNAKRRLKERSSDGMAHALYEGHWKLVIGMTDEPAALYNLADDPAEQKNLIDASNEASRVHAMASVYREIRGSKRSVPTKE
jgi:arylsulfatase A-like enzyme